MVLGEFTGLAPTQSRKTWKRRRNGKDIALPLLGLSRSGAPTIPPCHWFLLPSLSILVQEGLAILKLLPSPSRLPGVTPMTPCSPALPALSPCFQRPPGCSQELNPNTPDRCDIDLH